LRACGHLEIEDILVTGNDPAGPLQKHTQLGVGMSGSDVLDELVAAAGLAHHLHRHRARGGANFAHEHSADPTRLVSQNPPTTT
jgi:hypothetical protein